MLKATIRLLACSGLVSATAWSFDDQAAWPGACNVGKNQSPINIVTKNATPAPSTIRNLDISYGTVSGFNLKNNGHTWQVTLSPEEQAKNIIRGGPLGDTAYKLWQFHSHWGNATTNQGSEHQIDGKQEAAEVHFVHYNEKFANPIAAVKSGESDALSVIGVMLLESDYNSSREMLRVLKMAAQKVKTGPANVNVSSTLKVAKLLPISLQRTKDSRREAKATPILDNYRDVQPLNGRSVYRFKSGKQDWFTYSGSLTTPDCLEIVRWIVLNPKSKNNALAVNQETLDIFYSFYAQD